MTPLFFGERARRLFGLYTPAHARAGRPRGIVLCPPWGPEYLRAHRSLHQLGRLLAEAGFHVLRFDYHGTGDSAGDQAEATLEGWVEDIGTALDELKDTAGLQRVGLLGLRLGGSLALRAATRRRRDVDALVLWDPVLSGADHLAELRRLEALALGTHDMKADPGELLGFPLTPAQALELQALRLLEPVPAWPARTLVTLSQVLPGHAALREALAQVPGAAMAEVPGQPAWIEDRHSGAGAVPVRQLQGVVEWLNT